MPPPLRTLLGHLVLVRRKTGEEVNRYPIDSDRVTIGRWVQAWEGAMLILRQRL
jgi:hypothetical protein